MPPSQPPRSGRFAYYDRLGADDKRTYRKSDALGEVPLGDAPALMVLAEALRLALDGGEVAEVQRSASRFTRALLADLGASPVDVEVLEARPRGDYGELHGLYTWDGEEGERPRIQVWTRTAARGRVVAWKTFLRTLLHEIVHHLDIHWFDLEQTFHTRGFYRRENHLFQQLGEHERPSTPRPPTPRPPTPHGRSQSEPEPAAVPRKGQLRMPGF